MCRLFFEEKNRNENYDDHRKSGKQAIIIIKKIYMNESAKIKKKREHKKAGKCRRHRWWNLTTGNYFGINTFDAMRFTCVTASEPVPTIG